MILPFGKNFTIFIQHRRRLAESSTQQRLPPRRGRRASTTFWIEMRNPDYNQKLDESIQRLRDNLREQRATLTSVPQRRNA